jgi:hypothetical protein
MSPVTKAALLIGGGLTAVLAAPVLIVASLLPNHTSTGFFGACAELRGARAGIVPDPPSSPPTPDDVLLRISRTATTLGYGRQGETVAAAISIRATGLANAANPAVPATERYAHSAVIDAGIGALGLPPSWGSPAELMTPEVATALVMDQMVNQISQWRDTDPAQIAAQLLGGTAEDYHAATAAASARLSARPAPAVPAPGPILIPAGDVAPAPAAATLRPTAVASPTPAAPPSAALSVDQARRAAQQNPAAAACASALTTIVPPAAPGPNPRGAALAAAATATLGSEVTRPVSAEFVADLLAEHAVTVPATIAAQIATGWSVTEPAAGDLVFVDISADQGPHLVGIAVDTSTMVTVFPGRSYPESAPIGPNRLIRRLEVRAA